MENIPTPILMIITSVLLVLSPNINAQYGPNATDPDKKTKIVRGCEYEIIPGLAEITSVRITRPANESVLEYDEHEILFKFTSMEGGEVLEMLKEAELEFRLRSRAANIPVGPKYIERKNLKVGTKYAMNLLQTKNKDACLEQFTYESKALDNDLFEAEELLIPFIKADYENQLVEKEQVYKKRQVNEVSELVPSFGEVPTNSLEDLGEGVDITTMTLDEMKTYVAKRLEKKQQQGTLTNSQKYNLGINIDSLRAATEKKLRTKYKDELNTAHLMAENKPVKKPVSSKINAIQQAKKAAKEKEHQDRLLAKKNAQKEKERQVQIEKLRNQIAVEIDEQIQIEIAAKKAVAQRQLDDEQQEKLALEKKQQAALNRIKKIEEEMSDRMTKETQRKDCTFGERISGIIEVVTVRKAKTAEESYLGYTEYEVLVSFRPDNWSDLSKKEKASWEKATVFTLDPKGVNGNPSAAYIRKYRLFKASKYKGFAQKIESGICNEAMFCSPDLPIDAKQLNLK